MMEIDISRQIAAFIASRFDAFGVSRLPKGKFLLILGLESTPERNLDDFGHSGGGFQMYGFEKYAKPRLEALVKFIGDLGFSAEPVGRYGYPLKGKLNLKKEAIRTGLGKRGKNTVVLHPRFGTRLRFMAVRTDAPLEPLTSPVLTDEASPTCNACSICIDACPSRALKPYRMLDASFCLSNISPVDANGRSILCDICLHLCPAGQEGKGTGA